MVPPPFSEPLQERMKHFPCCAFVFEHLCVHVIVKSCNCQVKRKLQCLLVTSGFSFFLSFALMFDSVDSIGFHHLTRCLPTYWQWKSSEA
jgi:hypothetical protein